MTMRRWAALVAALALVAGVASACGGDGDSSDDGATVSTTEPTTEAATAPTTERAPGGGLGGSGLADRGWSVVPGSILLEEDFVDDFDGTMRIRNGTGSPATAVFTLQVFKGGKRVARMRGFTAGSVEPGRVRTVPLISIHNYVPGPYTFAFQTDQSIPGRRAPGRG